MKTVTPVNFINNIKSNEVRQKPALFFGRDAFCFSGECSCINKDVLVQRKIIPASCDLSLYFKEISNKVFTSKENADLFCSLLNSGKIALSSSVLKNIQNPASAVVVELDDSLSDGGMFLKLGSKLAQGKGVGINFSKFKNPTDKIKKINSYFKFREKVSTRPPAGIALLNVTNPEILNFITLKDDEDFKNWCFDLSVILPSDFIDKVDNNADITLDNGVKLNSRVVYDKLVNSMLKKGEPGIIFSDDKNYICDPCGAKKLLSNEEFTISHINLSKFYDSKNNSVDYKKLKQTSKILSKAMKNIDNNSCIGVVGYNELLEKLKVDYSNKKAKDILSSVLKVIKKEANKNGIKTAISPTGTVSKYLNTTAGIQPKNYDKVSYTAQLETIASAQKYIDCNISNTIILDKNADKSDVDKIIRYANKNKLKGITVFKP